MDIDFFKKTQIYFPTFTVKYWCLWEIEMKSFILKALSLLWQWGAPSLLQAGRGWKGYSGHTDLTLSSAAIFFFDWKKLLCPCVPNKAILPCRGGRRLTMGRHCKRSRVVFPVSSLTWMWQPVSCYPLHWVIWKLGLLSCRLLSSLVCFLTIAVLEIVAAKIMLEELQS